MLLSEEDDAKPGQDVTTLHLEEGEDIGPAENYAYAIEVAKTEVTQKDFTRVMGWNPSFFGGCGTQCIQNSTEDSEAQGDGFEEEGEAFTSECFDVSALEPKSCGETCRWRASHGLMPSLMPINAP